MGVKSKSTGKSLCTLEMYGTLQHEGITILEQDPIGKGSFSTVCIAFSTPLNRNVAIKIIDTRPDTEYIQRFLPRELEIVPILNHANVIKVHQILRTPAYTTLVQEYGENGDLLKLILSQSNNRIDEVESRFLFRQLMEAIRYLDKQHIVHRDIKCENIFLDRYTNVKLGDFGFARFLHPAQDTDTHCGSKAYVAPELLQGKRYTGNGTDIWSAGVVLYIMLTGKMPFNDSKPADMCEQQLKQKVKFDSAVVTSNAQELIRQMIHPRRDLRATTREIVSSKWLKDCRYFMRGKVEDYSTCSTASSSTLDSDEIEEE